MLWLACSNWCRVPGPKLTLWGVSDTPRPEPMPKPPRALTKRLASRPFAVDLSVYPDGTAHLMAYPRKRHLTSAGGGVAVFNLTLSATAATELWGDLASVLGYDVPDQVVYLDRVVFRVCKATLPRGNASKRPHERCVNLQVDRKSTRLNSSHYS